MLQQDHPDDYVIGTGEMHSVREFVATAFQRADLDWQEHVLVDPQFYRPAEVDELLADPTKAAQRLRWQPRVTFEELVHEMVDADLASHSMPARGVATTSGRLIRVTLGGVTVWRESSSPRGRHSIPGCQVCRCNDFHQDTNGRFSSGIADMEARMRTPLRLNETVDSTTESCFEAVRHGKDSLLISGTMKGTTPAVTGRPSVALVTPWKQVCGNARYAEKLAAGLSRFADVVPVTLVPAPFDKGCFEAIAEEINRADPDVVHIQHEYCFFGTSMAAANRQLDSLLERIDCARRADVAYGARGFAGLAVVSLALRSRFTAH